MQPLPDDISASLARSLGSYIRRVPRHELPPRLRRLQGFRPRTLLRYREELIAALEDEALREAVLSWLEEGAVKLPERDEDLLRIAAARQEGWREELLGRAAPAEPADEEDRVAVLEQALADERERTRGARQEARAALEATRTELSSERARAARLERELSAARRALDEARAELAEARRSETDATEQHERRLRRETRELTKARAERTALRAQLKQERGRAERLQRELDALRTGSEEQPARGRAPAAEPPEPATPPRHRRRARRPLRTPPGRFDDDPETLDDWLQEPAVHLLVDGYNVTMAEGGYAGVEPRRQRRLLSEDLERLATRRNVRVTLVFDGSELPPGIARSHHGRLVEVEYSRPPASADDHLEELVERLPPDPVIVVTNDRGLRDRVQALGATVARADQLLTLLGR